MFTGTATPKLGLPQWEPTDHPDFLTDINEAFKSIDENANEFGEEIKDVPKQISDLQALTQSLNEDTQQMIGEIAAINIALGNLRGETDKIDPIETQVQGLQVIAQRQSDAIHELQTIASTSLSYNTPFAVISGDKQFNISQVSLRGNILRIAGDLNGFEISQGAMIFVNNTIQTEIVTALRLTGKTFTTAQLGQCMLLDSEGKGIGTFVLSSFNESGIAFLVDGLFAGTVTRTVGYTFSTLIRELEEV